MMTFEQWRATRKEHSDLGTQIDDASLQGVAGYTYDLGAFVERTQADDRNLSLGDFHVIVERSEYYGNLDGAEQFLWDNFASYEAEAEEREWFAYADKKNGEKA